MAKTKIVPTSSVSATSYEPFMYKDKPFGEVHWLRTTSGTEGRVLYAGLWKSDPATIDYAFDAGDETIHVLKGNLRVEMDTGEIVELQPGDIASFPKGHSCRWIMTTPFAKFFAISA